MLCISEIKRHRLNIVYFLILLPVTYVIYVSQTEILRFLARNLTPKPHIAYIISDDCTSTAYLRTKANIEKAFPNYFIIRCHKNHRSVDSERTDDLKVVNDNRKTSFLTFKNLWTTIIPLNADDNEFKWSFVFEESVDFIDSKSFNIKHLTFLLKETMDNKEIKYTDGFFYLGTCEPTLLKKNFDTNIPQVNQTITIGKARGNCLYATGITTNRARHFWSNITHYAKEFNVDVTDAYFSNFCHRAHKSYYVLGTNIEHGTKSIGIAFKKTENMNK